MIDLLPGQPHIAVALLAGDFAAKPTWMLKFPTARVVLKFSFRHHQTMVAAVINVDLDLQLLPGNFVAGLAQSTSLRSRPERRKLFRAQPDLAFFSAGAAPATDFERKRHHLALFSQTNVSAPRFVRQITLTQRKMSGMENLHRQALD